MRCWSSLFIMALVGCAPPPHLPDPVARPGPSFRTSVTTRDGVDLFTRVFLPKGQEPFPTVLFRVPYPMGPLLARRCATFNRHGYACAFQEARGRGRSGGVFQPFENEPADGRDAIAWLAEQPWCDGNIALLGESYLGANAWAVVDDPPPELKTIIPTVISTDLYAASFQGGMFRHDIATAWMSLMPGPEFRYFSGSRHYHRALRRRPRLEMDVASAGREIPWFRQWLTDSGFRDRADVVRLRELPSRTHLPVLTMAGWSDAFLGPQLDSFAALASRDRSTLVIGPWDHLTDVAAAVPQRGLDDEVGLADDYFQWPRVLDWLGHHLRGQPLRYPVGGVASYAVNGGGWTWYDEWPPPSEPLTLALSPGGDPQRCTGVLAAEGGEGTVGWRYDPDDPTPSHGGAGVLAGSFPLWRGAEPGFLDQGRMCERRDDLVGFVSAPLSDPIHVAGAPSATLRVSTDAADTSFSVRFLEERPDGQRIHVREAIGALSAREGAAPYQPGTQVEITLEAWPVEYVFEAGSRVLVQVGSASFPKYEAHANTAEPWASAVETVVATQELSLQGSRVTLPVLVTDSSGETTR